MRRQSLGDLELEILRHIAQHGSATVGEVTDGFATPRGLSRSTINTSIERLFKKGYLTRASADGEAYRYATAVPADEVLRGLVAHFVENTLAGSIQPFVAYFARRQSLSDDEVSELRALVDALEAGRDNDPAESPGADA